MPDLGNFVSEDKFNSEARRLVEDQFLERFFCLSTRYLDFSLESLLAG